MSELREGFEADLRISPVPAIFGLAVVGFVVFAASGTPFDLGEKLNLAMFAVFIFALAAIAWYTNRKASWIGQWVTIVAWIIVIDVASIWLGGGVSQALGAIPIALATALVGLSAAAAVGFGQTLLVIFLTNLTGWDVTFATTFAAILAIWGTFGVMALIYTPIHRVAGWAWEYFQRAQGLLEDARNRRAELERALEDLSDANLQLTRLNLLAQGLRQVAEDARTAKAQFVANVSHELRTPLNMITGFSEMILQAPETYGGKVPSALLADLAVIQRNAEHLSELIDDVLDLSQVETGQMALTKEYVPFQAIIETATMAVRPLFNSKELTLETDVAEDLPPIFCDRTRIREVLLNLLSNAGRFTERGGVHLRAKQVDNDLVVTVTDTGHGIAAEDMHKLFQPFQQLDGTIRRRYGGTGLGLNISKSFIELHDGEIWVESQKGIGTTFSFRLPITPPTPIRTDTWRKIKPDWEFFQRTSPPKAPQTVISPRFVIWETGDALQRLITRYLDGADIVAVRDLAEGIDELSRVPAQAFLVNGSSVSTALEQLLTSSQLPESTPVIVCSIPGIRESSTEMGVAERLIKPISRKTLLDTLNQLGVQEGTVLIIDDEPDALQLFGRLLASSESTYRVLLARNGREALNVIQDSRPDVILLDLIMPFMDGFQFLEIQQADSTLRDIPVVVISARDPAGQPIVSSALAVTRGDGLSVNQLLRSIEFISSEFSGYADV